jgi:hypothetical protein
MRDTDYLTPEKRASLDPTTLIPYDVALVLASHAVVDELLAEARTERDEANAALTFARRTHDEHVELRRERDEARAVLQAIADARGLNAELWRRIDAILQESTDA